MAELFAVNAKFGDCLLLKWEHKGKPLFALIDGGPPGTYKESLSDALDTLGVTHLQLIVNSHVDGDHVGGLLGLLAVVRHDERQLTVGELWHNQFSATVDSNGGSKSIDKKLRSLSGNAAVATAGSFAAVADGQLQSILQGSQLLGLAQDLKISVNTSNSGKPFIVDGGYEPFTMLGPDNKPTSMKVTVVGPTQEHLETLREEWEAWVDKALRAPAAAMTEKRTPNLSSIQMLIEDGPQRILLTGDGRGDDLLRGLKQNDLLDRHGNIDVDILKVSHHGSTSTNNEDFFKQVRAKTYVISADGTYGHPEVDVLEWIRQEAKRSKRPITIVLTNTTKWVEKWRKGLSTSDRCTVRVRASDESFIKA